MVWCPVLKQLSPPKVSFLATETEKSSEKLSWVTTSKEIIAMLNYANLLAMWLTATLLTTPFWPLGVCRAGFFPVSCRGCLTGILMCSNIANIDLGNFPWRLARSHNEHFSHAKKKHKKSMNPLSLYWFVTNRCSYWANLRVLNCERIL